jgi:isopenicillin N synthase-like dioxygenase
MLVLRHINTAKSALQHIRTFTDIPVVDVAALVDNSASSKAKEHVGQQLHLACCKVGFFYIQNHGVWRASQYRETRYQA